MHAQWEDNSGPEVGCPLDEAPALSPAVAEVVAYWQSIRPAPDLLPGRQHFDPLDLAKVMRRVWLLDCVSDGAATTPRFRCRLYGTELVEAFGYDLTGKFLDEADVGFTGSAAEADFLAVHRSGQGFWWRGPVAMKKLREVAGVEVVMLPLAADGRAVDKILCYVDIL